MALSPSRGRKGQRHHLLFPLEGKCRAAAKGCTRPRVEKKGKGSPDRQTAACLGECHLRLLPCSTPAPLRGPLPLKGAQGAAVLCALTISNGVGGSGTISCFPLRGNAALAAKGCTRLCVEMKRKGSPDRQTAACFWGMPLAVFAIVHPRATMWPSPPQGGARGSGALCSCHLKGAQGSAHFLKS